MIRRNFAKLFETKALGQVLVINNTNDNGDPSVQFKFDAGQFNSDFGISAVDMSNTKEGCEPDVFDKYFESVDQDKVDKIAENLKEQFKDLIED